MSTMCWTVAVSGVYWTVRLILRALQPSSLFGTGSWSGGKSCGAVFVFWQQFISRYRTAFILQLTKTLLINCKYNDIIIIEVLT